MKKTGNMWDLKGVCYAWFNATSRKDWNDFTIESAKHELKTSPGQFPPFTSAEIMYETMCEIIEEYDKLNEED